MTPIRVISQTPVASTSTRRQQRQQRKQQRCPRCPSKLNGCAKDGFCQERDLQIDGELEKKCTSHRVLRVPPSNELGLGASEFREAMHRVSDEYLQYAERVARGQEEVRAKVQPGYLRPLLPTQPPEEPTSLDTLLADFKKHLLPGVWLSAPSLLMCCFTWMYE